MSGSVADQAQTGRVPNLRKRSLHPVRTQAIVERIVLGSKSPHALDGCRRWTGNPCSHHHKGRLRSDYLYVPSFDPSIGTRLIPTRIRTAAAAPVTNGANNRLSRSAGGGATWALARHSPDPGSDFRFVSAAERGACCAATPDELAYRMDCRQAHGVDAGRGSCWHFSGVPCSEAS